MQKNKVFRLVVCVISLVIMASFTGCAKQKTYGAVKFITNPPGAQVIHLQDDATLGRSPVIVFFEGRDKTPEYVTVRMRKAGYKDEITSLWVNTRHDTREGAELTPQPITVDLKKKGE